MSESPRPTTPAELMDQLDQALRTDPERTRGIETIFAFDVEGEAGGQWWIEARDGVGSAHAGKHPSPDVTVYVDDSSLVRLGTHELDGGEAYVSGIITLEGDHSRAMLLAQVFGE